MALQPRLHNIYYKIDPALSPETIQQLTRLEFEEERERVRSAYRKALRDGVLVRPDACERCGAACRPDGHHEDYTRPLAVQWLCRSCHLAADVACGSRRRAHLQFAPSPEFLAAIARRDARLERKLRTLQKVSHAA